MDTNWLFVAVFIVGITALIGFFVTKTKGFGRFATSTFLLLLVVKPLNDLAFALSIRAAIELVIQPRKQHMRWSKLRAPGGDALEESDGLGGRALCLR